MWNGDSSFDYGDNWWKQWKEWSDSGYHFEIEGTVYADILNYGVREESGMIKILDWASWKRNFYSLRWEWVIMKFRFIYGKFEMAGRLLDVTLEFVGEMWFGDVFIFSIYSVSQKGQV